MAKKRFQGGAASLPVRFFGGVALLALGAVAVRYFAGPGFGGVFGSAGGVSAGSSVSPSSIGGSSSPVSSGAGGANPGCVGVSDFSRCRVRAENVSVLENSPFFVKAPHFFYPGAGNPPAVDARFPTICAEPKGSPCNPYLVYISEGVYYVDLPRAMGEQSPNPDWRYIAPNGAYIKTYNHVFRMKCPGVFFLPTYPYNPNSDPYSVFWTDPCAELVYSA